MSLRNEKWMKLVWRNFCQTTGMKGFTFYYQSETYVEKLLWGSALLFCFSMTTIDLVETWRNYLEFPTTTKLSMVIDKPFNLSNLTICLPYALSDLENYSVNIDDCKLVDTVLMQFADINVTRLMEEQLLDLWSYVRDNDQFELAKNFSQLVYITHTMLDSMVQTYLFINRSDHEHAVCLPTMRKFYDGYKLDEILRLTAALQLCTAGFYVKLGLYLPENHCNTEQISWLGGVQKDPNQLCVVIKHSALSFPDGRASLLLQFNSNRLFRSYSYSSAYLLFAGDRFVTSQIDQWTSAEFGASNDVDLQLLGHFKPSTKLQCIHSSPMECVLKCRAEYINFHCNCKPIFAAVMPFWHSDKQWCYRGNISNETSECQNLTTYLRWMDNCRDKKCALPQCHGEKVYSLVVGSASMLTEANNQKNLTQVYIYIQSFVYPTFIEVPALNFRQFLAQLGGNLSLWLGASFLVVIHLLVVLLKLPYLHIVHRKQKQQESRSPKLKDLFYQHSQSGVL